MTDLAGAASAIQSPVLAKVNFDQGNIVVNWQPIAGSTFFLASVFLGSNPVNGASSIDQGFGTIITPNPALPNNQTYQVMVAQCDQNGTQTSPYSQPFTLIQNPPTNINVFLDGDNSLQVSWIPPGFGNPTGASVDLIQTGMQNPLASVQAEGNSAILQPGTPLLASNSYSLYVIPFNNNGGSTGPDASVPLLLQPASVNSVTYSAEMNQVQGYAHPPLSPPANMGVFITLYVNGVQAGMNTDGVLISATIPLQSANLDYSSLYTVTLRYGLNGAYGPETLPVIVVISQPVLKTLAFSGPKVEAAWKNLPARYIVTGGLIGLIGDGKGLNNNNVQGDSGPVSVPASPVCNQYQVQVYATFGNSRGPRSQPVTVPSVAPVISSITFDGSNLTVTWGQTTNAPGYRCIISDSSGRVAATADTIGVTASVNLKLDPAVAYHATVYAYGNISDVIVSGPVSASANIISVAPLVTSLQYNNGTLTVKWNASALSNVTGITGYEVGLYLDSQLQGNLHQVAGANTGTVDIPVTLFSWQKYTIALRATGAACKGPFSENAVAISDSPLPSGMVYDGTAVQMEWTLASNSAVTGYLVTLFKDGVSQPLTNDNYTSATQWYFKTPLASGSVWTAAVQAMSCLAQGPFSGSLTIINDVVQVLSASYDGSVVRATRGTLTSLYVTGYNFVLLEGNKVFQSLSTADVSIAIPVQLAPDANYSIQVQATGNNILGKFSEAVSLLTVPPQISAVLYDGTTLTVNWNVINVATGYKLELFDEDVPVSITPQYNGTQATATIALSSWKNYQVQVLAIAGTVSGPPSNREQVIALAPVLSQLLYDGSNASVSWNTFSALYHIAYLATLFKDGVAQPITAANYSSGDKLVFTGGLAAGSVWTVAVQAVTDKATGPVSGTLTFIIDSIMISSAAYNEAMVTASWPKLNSSNVNGYWLSLLQGGKTLESIFTNDLTASINYRLDPANNYSLQVQAAGNKTIGPGSQIVSLLSAPISVISVVYQAGILTVGWNGNIVFTSYQLVLYNDDKVIPCTPVYDGNSAIVTIELDNTKRYYVRVNGVNGIVSGLHSEPGDIINTKPIIREFNYDGANLKVEWEAVNQEIVTGYRVELSDSGNHNTVLNVPFNNALIPVVFSDTLTYSLRVCAIGNKATGPFSDSINPYVVAPAYYLAPYIVNIQPWISRSGTRPPVPAAFNLYLPQLFITPPNPLPPALAPGGTSPFQMSITNNPALPYMLAIAVASDAWQFNNEPLRSSLQTDYLNFITAMENVTGGLLPGTVPFLQQLIARSFPLSFDETIYYAAGYNLSGRYVNLQAGMRLSLSFGEYQFTGPAQANENTGLLNGFIGSGGVSYVMGSYLSGATQSQQVLDLGFSNFLSAIIQNVDSNSGGGANILDLYTSSFRQPYFRVIYPQSFASADSKGWADSTKNVTVLGAVNYQILEQATGVVLNGGAMPVGAYSTFFRGRVSIIPEIQVYLNGRPKWVAVGTTVRNLLEENSEIIPRSVVNSGTRQIMNIKLMRLADNIITDLADTSSVSLSGIRNEVSFSYKAITTYSNGKDDFDLPLLQGDSLVTENHKP